MKGARRRVVNTRARTEFYVEFPNTPSPWGISPEMDELIWRARTDAAAVDRTFLEVTKVRYTEGVSIQLLAGEDAETAIVELVARTLHPDEDWVFDERALIEHVNGGWLITLFPEYRAIIVLGGEDAAN